MFSKRAAPKSQNLTIENVKLTFPEKDRAKLWVHA